MMLPIHQEQEACSMTTSEVKTRSQLSPKAKRSVSFSLAVEVFFVLDNDGYTWEEFESCWFSPRAYRQMRKEIAFTRDMIENNECSTIDEEKYCVRGVKKEYDKVNTWKSRMDAIDAVLDEQELQRDKAKTTSEGSVQDHAEEIISCIYSDLVYGDRLEACFRGVADEQIARTINSNFGSSSKTDEPHLWFCTLNYNE
jgi:hypothetical protein